MNHGFNRHWSRHAESLWHQHRGGWGSPWGSWGEGPWGRSTGGRPGPPPWVAGLFGLAQGEQPRGPRVRRGDVRAAILDVLRAEPRNGYQIISEISERSGGAWKPSPGSVYPTISQLEDEGLIEADDDRGRRLLRLTDEGRDYVERNAEELAGVWTPFAHPGRPGSGGADFSMLKPEIGQVMNAVWQIITTGTDQQKRDAIDVLVDTRRRLYGLLAEGDPDADQDRGEGELP